MSEWDEGWVAYDTEVKHVHVYKHGELGFGATAVPLLEIRQDNEPVGVTYSGASAYNIFNSEQAALEYLVPILQQKACDAHNAAVTAAQRLKELSMPQRVRDAVGRYVDITWEEMEPL